MELLLKGLGLQEYLHTFEEERISLEQLPRFKPDMLRIVGIKLGDALRIIEAAEALLPALSSKSYAHTLRSDSEAHSTPVSFAGANPSSPQHYDPLEDPGFAIRFPRLSEPPDLIEEYLDEPPKIGSSSPEASPEWRRVPAAASRGPSCEPDPSTSGPICPSLGPESESESNWALRASQPPPDGHHPCQSSSDSHLLLGPLQPELELKRTPRRHASRLFWLREDRCPEPNRRTITICHDRPEFIYKPSVSLVWPRKAPSWSSWVTLERMVAVQRLERRRMLFGRLHAGLDGQAWRLRALQEGDEEAGGGSGVDEATQASARYLAGSNDDIFIQDGEGWVNLSAEGDIDSVYGEDEMHPAMEGEEDIMEEGSSSAAPGSKRSRQEPAGSVKHGSKRIRPSEEAIQPSLVFQRGLLHLNPAMAGAEVLEAEFKEEVEAYELQRRHKWALEMLPKRIRKSRRQWEAWNNQGTLLVNRQAGLKELQLLQARKNKFISQIHATGRPWQFENLDLTIVHICSFSFDAELASFSSAPSMNDERWRTFCDSFGVQPVPSTAVQEGVAAHVPNAGLSAGTPPPPPTPAATTVPPLDDQGASEESDDDEGDNSFIDDSEQVGDDSAAARFSFGDTINQNAAATAIGAAEVDGAGVGGRSRGGVGENHGAVPLVEYDDESFRIFWKAQELHAKLRGPLDATASSAGFSQERSADDAAPSSEQQCGCAADINLNGALSGRQETEGAGPRYSVDVSHECDVMMTNLVGPDLGASSGEVAAAGSGEEAAAASGEEAAGASGEVAAAGSGEEAANASGEEAAGVSGEVAAAIPWEDAALASGEVAAAGSDEVAAAAPGEHSREMKFLVVANVIRTKRRIREEFKAEMSRGLKARRKALAIPLDQILRDPQRGPLAALRELSQLLAQDPSAGPFFQPSLPLFGDNLWASLWQARREFVNVNVDTFQPLDPGTISASGVQYSPSTTPMKTRRSRRLGTRPGVMLGSKAMPYDIDSPQEEIDCDPETESESEDDLQLNADSEAEVADVDINAEESKRVQGKRRKGRKRPRPVDEAEKARKKIVKDTRRLDREAMEELARSQVNEFDFVEAPALSQSAQPGCSSSSDPVLSFPAISASSSSELDSDTETDSSHTKLPRKSSGVGGTSSEPTQLSKQASVPSRGQSSSRGRGRQVLDVGSRPGRAGTKGYTPRERKASPSSPFVVVSSTSSSSEPDSDPDSGSDPSFLGPRHESNGGAPSRLTKPRKRASVTATRASVPQDGRQVADGGSGPSRVRTTASAPAERKVSSSPQTVGRPKGLHLAKRSKGAVAGPSQNSMRSPQKLNRPSEPEVEVEVTDQQRTLAKDVLIHEKLARVMKEHQREGVKFLWTMIVEKEKIITQLRHKKNSQSQYSQSQNSQSQDSDPENEYSRTEDKGQCGCILAHNMGLGKTLQILIFIHTVFHFPKPIPSSSPTTFLIIAPCNTLINWKSECNHWISQRVPDQTVPVSLVLDSGVNMLDALRKWHQTGGILIMGYEKFRDSVIEDEPKQPERLPSPQNAASPSPVAPCEVAKLEPAAKTKKKKVDPETTAELRKLLCKPGPDFVILDEGHRIKSDSSKISRALALIATKRRIVLTGYPLQNNLWEYYHMCNFVYPNMLKTKKSFEGRFVNVIMRGTGKEADEEDVKKMNKRLYVLHHMVRNFVQRKDASVLLKTMPIKKHEYILCIGLSEAQKELYLAFLRAFQNGEVAERRSPLIAHRVGQKIWNHVQILRTLCEELTDRKTRKENLAEEENVKRTVNIGYAWAQAALKKQVDDNVEVTLRQEAPKFLVLLDIIRASVAQNDKVIVFSSCISTLDLIEKVLKSTPINGITWAHGSTYYRIDGKTKVEKRQSYNLEFNRPDSSVRVFLSSTVAGGIGINLVGGNRVVIMDSCWNPCHDVQAIFRAYRYGQHKDVFIYRLVAAGTIEQKIYKLQVFKQGIFRRVVDEQTIRRHFTREEVGEYLNYEEADTVSSELLHQDKVLREVVERHLRSNPDAGGAQGQDRPQRRRLRRRGSDKVSDEEQEDDDEEASGAGVFGRRGQGQGRSRSEDAGSVPSSDSDSGTAGPFGCIIGLLEHESLLADDEGQKLTKEEQLQGMEEYELEESMQREPSRPKSRRHILADEEEGYEATSSPRGYTYTGSGPSQVGSTGAGVGPSQPDGPMSNKFLQAALRAAQALSYVSKYAAEGRMPFS